MEELKFKLYKKPGTTNTQETLEIAKKNAEILNIKNIIIASTSGSTIKKAINIFDLDEFNLICVTHNYGFKENVEQTFPAEVRKELLKKGVKFVTGTLAFSGVESALLRKYQHYDTVSMYSRLLRVNICQGIKVTMEIILMAVDAGKIKFGDDAICVAGTGRGADTCCLIKASSSRYLEKLRIKAIFTKPM